MKIDKVQEGDLLRVRLSGPIDENFDLNSLLGGNISQYHLNCKGIDRANSVGLKKWHNFFRSLRADKKTLRFFECSPVVIEQANVLVGFVEKSEIESLCLHYFCPKCKKESLPVFTVTDLKKLKFVVPDIPCLNCNGTTTFDDIPEQFFTIFFE